MANIGIPGQRGGLRERKKLAVRRALGSAAVRLAVEPSARRTASFLRSRSPPR